MKERASRRTTGFTESVIREMTRLINLHHPEDGINLAQGFPDFSAPQVVKDAACSAIQADLNQYAITWGARDFREAIARKTKGTLRLDVDPETEITVCCGATEAMISSMLAVVNPGDEVIIFEPFYENYGPDCALADARPRFVRLHPPEWRFEQEELASAFGPLTRAIVLNTPNNPTGKVFSRDELEFIGSLCSEWDTFVLTDEIYEHLVYDGFEHVSPATLPGMRDRTIVINGLSKTYSLTGWRVGYVIAPPDVAGAIRKVHDFLTVGAAAPLQAAGVVALELPESYYKELCQSYLERRDFLVPALDRAGFNPAIPHGAYYVMCDISQFDWDNDVAFARYLVEEHGLAAVPGSSFYSDPEEGRKQVRFAFPKKMETLRRAEAKLMSLAGSRKLAVRS